MIECIRQEAGPENCGEVGAKAESRSTGPKTQMLKGLIAPSAKCTAGAFAVFLQAKGNAASSTGTCAFSIGKPRVPLENGARYGELAHLEVRDFNPDAGTITIRISKTDKVRHIILTEEGTAFFKRLCAGRGGHQPMLARAD
jgi:hypothetical protein